MNVKQGEIYIEGFQKLWVSKYFSLVVYIYVYIYTTYF